MIIKKNDIYKKLNLKLGDYVKIISGAYRGLVGKINFIFPKKKLLSLNTLEFKKQFIKKLTKKKSKQINIINLIHISNVMPWDIKNEIASRIDIKRESNSKYRIFKKTKNIF